MKLWSEFCYTILKGASKASYHLKGFNGKLSSVVYDQLLLTKMKKKLFY